MQYPPKAKSKRETGFMATGASKYPAKDEKTTLIASRALVISLKSEKTKDQVELFAVLTAVFIYWNKWFAKISPNLLFYNELDLFNLSCNHQLKCNQLKVYDSLL